MTPIVNGTTTHIINGETFASRSTTLGVVAIGLLIGLLVAHQLLQGAPPRLGRRRLEVLDIAVLPLVIAFVVIIAARIAGFRYPVILR
jgi:hypothetical protein